MVFEPFEDESDFELLAEKLADADPAVRRVAVMDLADTADPEAIPLIARVVSDNSAEVRLQAAIAGTRPSSMLDLQARVGESGAIEHWDVVARLRGDEMEPYIPDWQVDGTISVQAHGVLSEGVGEMQVGAALDSVRGPEGLVAN